MATSGSAPAPEVNSREVVQTKPSTVAAGFPPEIIDALDTLPRKDATGLLSFFFSRSITNAGPDPETAKIMAQSEMHEEECKLKAFQANLEGREKQSVRDHDFRKKKLNHASIMSAIVIGVTVCGVAGGLALTVTGSPIGSPVLVASFTMLSSIAGKLLGARDKD
jgi:hypothetical protein